MDLQQINIVIIILCTILSALFSGSESALFSLKKADIHRFSHSKHRTERAIYSLMKNPQAILITLLIGNLFVNLVISMLSTELLLRRWPEWGHVISIAIVTPLLLVFCEISPKVMAIHSYESASKRVLPVIRLFHLILAPVRVVLLIFTNTLIRVFNLNLSHQKITKDELGMAVRMGEQHGVLGKDEGTFIKNVLRFSKKDASNVMFPRNSAVFLQNGMSVDEAMAVFLSHGVIRIPVYEGDLDHVIGLVDSRDLMPCYLGYRKARTINRFIREIQFFPATRDLNDLLNDFLSQGIQLAIVVDEYGGTAGVVTLNKLLSELMGRDMTRWEDDSKHEIRRVDENVSIVSGEMQIDDFNHAFGERLESRNADSIGGYIIEQLSYIPKRGEVLKIEGHLLRVRYMRRHKIETVEVIMRSDLEELI
ncbi:MAG TPA: hemolysin family protein [Spirochaetota bacterium]|nr:HlyC/CorC family transporter [Spirochaetota bacterium]HOD16583.1 hemolysin family protein [Spirochaetota bacterium]HPG50859.1 hemolysin family protein [Spirochaetota bacterium]HPN11368.1 hemolysin family protein [Spirochaetota bacterium]